MVDGLGVFNAKLMTENHVAKFYGMREQRIFLQLLESGRGVVVVHRRPPADRSQPDDCTHLEQEKKRGRGVGSSTAVTGRVRRNCELGRGVKKFVAINLGGHSRPAIVRGLDAHDLPLAADIHVA